MYEYRAEVRSVYDGDTIRADINLGFGVVLENQKLRLLGINTPEIRGDSREHGLMARDALRDKIEGMTVTVRTHKDSQGKYGRWLAVVYLGEENVNEWLLNHGFATKYQG